MGEFDSDYTEDRDTDSDLVRQLRAQLREKDKQVKVLNGEVEKFRETTVESAIKAALAGVPDGKKAKVEKLIRAGAKNPEDVQAWLDEYADVFDIRAGVDVAGQSGDDSDTEGTGGVDESTRDGFEQVQRLESGAGVPPKLGTDRASKLLDDAKGGGMGGFDALIEKLRAEGLAQ